MTTMARWLNLRGQVLNLRIIHDLTPVRRDYLMAVVLDDLPSEAQIAIRTGAARRDVMVNPRCQVMKNVWIQDLTPPAYLLQGGVTLFERA